VTTTLVNVAAFGLGIGQLRLALQTKNIFRGILATGDIGSTAADQYINSYYLEQSLLEEYTEQETAAMIAELNKYNLAAQLFLISTSAYDLWRFTKGKNILRFAEYPNIQNWVDTKKPSEEVLASLDSWRVSGDTRLATLNRDLLENTHFFDNFGGRVKAWEALFDLPLLRVNPTKLKAVDDFATSKNIDASLVKTELNNLPTHKEDLIKSFEISNGTASPSTIPNRGRTIDTDGSLLGRLVNGQFVPVGNANAIGTMDYVILQSGEILLGFKHTFLTGGADVLAAGTVKFNNGSIRAITNASGHYIPTPDEGMNFLRMFKDNGADISSATFSIYKEGGTLFREIAPTANVRKLYE